MKYIITDNNGNYIYKTKKRYTSTGNIKLAEIFRTQMDAEKIIKNAGIRLFASSITADIPWVSVETISSPTGILAELSIFPISFMVISVTVFETSEKIFPPVVNLYE